MNPIILRPPILTDFPVATVKSPVIDILAAPDIFPVIAKFAIPEILSESSMMTPESCKSPLTPLNRATALSVTGTGAVSRPVRV